MKVLVTVKWRTENCKYGSSPPACREETTASSSGQLATISHYDRLMTYFGWLPGIGYCFHVLVKPRETLASRYIYLFDVSPKSRIKS
jgi:hypothetical protein